MVLILFSAFALGGLYYFKLPPFSVAEMEPLQNRVLISTSIYDDLPAHIIRIPADDGGPNDSQELRRAFLVSYYNTIPEPARADRCVGCEKCKEGCPYPAIKISKRMEEIDDTVTHVRRAYLENGGRLDGKGVLPC